ncbi:MAG: acetyl-CoA acetyltransferase, partial [Gammaproteobacteria bacterium]|nr:acetyl-CoA acetyltransferase [Gammaproteobacteria bacterium]
MSKLDSCAPVLVGSAAVEQRIEEPNAGQEPCAMMADAVKAAADDAGCPALLEEIQRIYVPQGMWSYTDPARLVAQSVGSPGATTVLAQFGILQQTLIGDACERIAQGEIDVAVVAGGEAKYRQLRGQIAGVEISETLQRDANPDVTLAPEAELWLEAESNAGLGMPVGFYAIMASALRASLGQSIEENRDAVAAMYQRFSEIAVDNPHAWRREMVPAEQIRNAGPKNPMLAFPYTKMHNTSWNVDQASGLIFTSVARAEALGIPREQWVFPLASTESNYILAMSQRETLHGLAGARAAGQKALEIGGIEAAGIDFWELYSCFPVAVEIYAREVGVAHGKDWTITGGMPFAGGPLNNYVLQSTVRMIELLRSNPGAKGMVSSVSGMLTKQAFGLWSTVPGDNAFEFADVTSAVKQANPPKEVLDSYQGRGSIAGYTVLFDGGEPQRAVVVVDIESSQRAVA